MSKMFFLFLLNTIRSCQAPIKVKKHPKSIIKTVLYEEQALLREKLALYGKEQLDILL